MVGTRCGCQPGCIHMSGKHRLCFHPSGQYHGCPYCPWNLQVHQDHVWSVWLGWWIDYIQFLHGTILSFSSRSRLRRQMARWHFATPHMSLPHFCLTAHSAICLPSASRCPALLHPLCQLVDSPPNCSRWWFSGSGLSYTRSFGLGQCFPFYHIPGHLW